MEVLGGHSSHFFILLPQNAITLIYTSITLDFYFYLSGLIEGKGFLEKLIKLIF